MEVVPQVGDNLSLTGHTLILPGAGGTAGVGELAIDAVITTFALSRSAVVQSPLLFPLVMSSAWKKPADQQSGRHEITTGAELYQSDKVPGLSVLQMRSPPIDGRRRALAKEIYSWAAKVGVAQIVIVGPCAAYTREDADINSTVPLRFAHVSGHGSEFSDLLAKAGLGEFIRPLAPPAAEGEEEDSGENRDLIAVHRQLRGGGLAKPLLLEAAEAADAAADAKDGLPKVLSLLAFAVSRVDMPTLEQLSKAACALAATKLGVQAPEMKFPPSWDLQAEANAKDGPMYLWN